MKQKDRLGTKEMKERNSAEMWFYTRLRRVSGKEQGTDENIFKKCVCLFGWLVY